MVRKANLQPKKHSIRWRSHEPSRLETFSDAVFAFAVTLIIVSLEVPKSFDELYELLRGFGSFAICFFMLFQIWNIQNTFFRRFGLRDNYTMVMNAALLFVVLFLVYPLKFLFNLIFGIGNISITYDQIPSLMTIYDGAYTVVFLLFFLMYRNAISQKEIISLTEEEVYLTNTIGYSYLLNACIGIFACLLANILPADRSGLSGFTYFIIGPVIGFWFGYRSKRLRLRYGQVTG